MGESSRKSLISPQLIDFVGGYYRSASYGL